MPQRLKTWLKVRLITGFFVIVPVVATGWLLWEFWTRVDGIFGPTYEALLGRRVRGLGFFTAIAIIFIAGAVARNVVGGRVLRWAEALLLKVPVFGRLYPSVRLLIESFSPDRMNSFKAVVLVTHPREGGYAFGFVTSETEVTTPAGTRRMVTVFVPTNNLYLGDIVVVPIGEVISTGMSVDEGLSIILSAGTATPARLPR